jgi:hypothetical protein
MIVSMATSHATIISGTWSFSVTAWTPCICGPAPAPVPADASATFSFNNTVVTMPVPPLPIAHFSTNFGATSAAALYFPGDYLVVEFLTPPSSLFGFDFNGASADPLANGAFWSPDDEVPNQAIATSFAGSFTPASVATTEPSALLLLAAGLSALGLMRRASRKGA